MEPEVAVDPHSVALGPFEGQLEGAEEAGQSRDGDGDKPQLPQDLLPTLASDPRIGGELMEDLGELDLAVGRE